MLMAMVDVNEQPMTRQEKAAATRRRILMAAQELFAEHGYAATTMQAIADRAGGPGKSGRAGVVLRLPPGDGVDRLSTTGRGGPGTGRVSDPWLGPASAPGSRGPVTLGPPRPSARVSRRIVNWGYLYSTPDKSASGPA